MKVNAATQTYHAAAEAAMLDLGMLQGRDGASAWVSASEAILRSVQHTERRLLSELGYGAATETVAEDPLLSYATSSGNAPPLASNAGRGTGSFAGVDTTMESRQARLRLAAAVSHGMHRLQREIALHLEELSRLFPKSSNVAVSLGMHSSSSAPHVPRSLTHDFTDTAAGGHRLDVTPHRAAPASSGGTSVKLPPNVAKYAALLRTTDVTHPVAASGHDTSPSMPISRQAVAARALAHDVSQNRSTLDQSQHYASAPPNAALAAPYGVNTSPGGYAPHSTQQAPSAAGAGSSAAPLPQFTSARAQRYAAQYAHLIRR